MRVVKPARVREFQDGWPKAGSSLGRWLELVETHEWSTIQELRRVFPSADAVKVASGRIVTVFNIAGHHYRLITAIHYNTKIVYVMRFMTHAQYSKDTWKESL